MGNSLYCWVCERVCSSTPVTEKEREMKKGEFESKNVWFIRRKKKYLRRIKKEGIKNDGVKV